MNKPVGDWRDIFNGFSIALDLRKMWLAFQGIVITFVILFVITTLCSSYYCAHAPEVRKIKGDINVASHIKRLDIASSLRSGADFLKGLLSTSGDELKDLSSLYEGQPFSLVHEVFAGLGAYHLRLLLSLGIAVCLLSWLVWCYYGGAISRIAAVEFATEGDRIELSEAGNYAKTSYTSYFWSPITVLIAIIFLGLCNVVAGLSARNFFATLVGVLGAFCALASLIYVREKSNSLATGIIVGFVVAAVTAVLCWVVAEFIPATSEYAFGRFSLGLGKVFFALIFCFILLSGFLLLLLVVGLGAPVLASAGLSALCFGLAIFLFKKVPLIGPPLIELITPRGELSTFMLLLLLSGGAMAFNLMLSAVSVDGSESFDAISRAFSYIYARPWKYFFYHLLAFLYGSACALFLIALVKGAILTGVVTAWLGTGSHSAGFEPVFTRIFEGTGQIAGLNAFCGALIAIPVLLILGLLWGFIVSLFITLKTIIYYLLRKSVDGDEVTSFYQPEEEEALQATEEKPAEEQPQES